MRSPSNVSISLCAYLSQYRVPTHSNIMNTEGNVINVYGLILFSISTTRLAESVEGLNSSLAQSPGEL